MCPDENGTWVVQIIYRKRAPIPIPTGVNVRYDARLWMILLTAVLAAFAVIRRKKRNR